MFLAIERDLNASKSGTTLHKILNLLLNRIFYVCGNVSFVDFCVFQLEIYFT